MKLLDKLFARHHLPADDGNDARSRNHARINSTINDALASAGLGDASDKGISAIINDALTRAGLRGPIITQPPGQVPNAPQASPADMPRIGTPRSEGDSAVAAGGQFLTKSFVNTAGKLAYKVYIPAGYDAAATRRYPLVVMLHGCTQSPDDFAAGTRMNVLADQHGLLVAYPEQSANANGSKCWNWFRPQDQARGMGEPALIAGMTAQVTADYHVDPARTYVAGLSAGAAMAVVLGRSYPDVFAAIGAHSGIPYKAAHDVGSAFAAMKSGGVRAADAGLRAAHAPVPTIVFHGDRDHTVSASNGEAIIAHVTGAATDTLASTHDSGTSRDGRRYTRTRHATQEGRILAEAWQVHGGGHAWMGGSANGTYTDPKGPDASAEMLRFFSAHTL